MKIAVLTSKERFDRYSEPAMIPADCEILHFGQTYTEDEVITRAGDAECIIVDAILPVTAKMIHAMPKLKLIHSEGVAFNSIDIDAAKNASVYVCNNKAINAGQVAEHSVLLILAVMRRLMEGDRCVREGQQMEAKTRFIYEGLSDLVNAKVGLIGFGAIGKELARRLAPFGCQLYYYDALRSPMEIEQEYNVTYLEQDELLRQCDVVTLHIPVTPETTNMICKDTLSMMKPTAILINCARGLVVNSADLAEAIQNGTIYGAGLDTTHPEPPSMDDPLLMLPPSYRDRIVFSPHIAGTTKSVFFASYRNIWNNITSIFDGKRPINVVNGL